MDDQLVGELVAEHKDQIEALYDDLERLRSEHQLNAAERPPRELIDCIFRRVHTIKGSSYGDELEAVKRIAHEVETLLGEVRIGRIAIEEEVLDALDDAANQISQSLSLVTRGHQPAVPQNLLARLRQLTEVGESRAEKNIVADAGTTAIASSIQLPADIKHSLGAIEQRRLAEATDEGASLFIITVRFNAATFAERFRILSNRLVEKGEIVAKLAGVAEGTSDQISFRLLYATAESAEIVAQNLSSFDAESQLVQ